MSTVDYSNGKPAHLPPADEQKAIQSGFLLGDVDGCRLRVFESLFTLAFFFRMGLCFMTWQEWLTPEGFHLNHAELLSLGYPPPFPLLNGYGAALLGTVMLTAGVGLILNRWRRLALFCLFSCALYVQLADIKTAYTINKLFVVVYFILLVTPGYSYRECGLSIPVVAIRILQATVILQYFSAGVSKAFAGDWMLHSDVLYTQVQGIFRTEFAAWLLRTLPLWAWTVMQWTSLLFELEAPVLFTVRKLRPIAFIFGFGLHIMIALTMNNLIHFSCAMCAFYALFLSGEEWRKILGRVTLGKLALG